MITAFVHGLYGEDFVQEALLSIVDQVDKVLFMWAEKPWYDITEVKNPCPGREGPTTLVPCPIDNMLYRVMQLNHPKIDLIKFSPPRDTFTMMYAAQRFIPRNTTTLIFTNGVDVIHYPDGLDIAIGEMRDFDLHLTAGQPVLAGVMTQRWTWRDLQHEALMSNHPSGSIIYDMKKIGWSHTAMKAAFNEENVRNAMATFSNVVRLQSPCWNVGLSYSYRTMKWRHEIRAAQVRAGLGYVPDDETWVDEVWARWGPSMPQSPSRFQRDVAKIVPLDAAELPEILRRRIAP